MASNSSNQPKINVGQPERMFSLGAGILLAVIGLRRSWVGLMIAGLGGYLVYRGATGNCQVYEALDMDSTNLTIDPQLLTGALSGPMVVEDSVTVNRSPAEVYLFWRNLENLPRFMNHLQSVSILGGGRSHWVAKTPVARVPLDWDAEITEERQNEHLAWRSLPGSRLMTSGAVDFRPVGDNGGTEVHLRMELSAPRGAGGAAVMRLLNKIARPSITEDMRRFRDVMESGEVTGGPGGEVKAQAYRQSPEESRARGSRSERDVVTHASEDSFPASDPPNYHAGID